MKCKDFGSLQRCYNHAFREKRYLSGRKDWKKKRLNYWLQYVPERPVIVEQCLFQFLFSPLILNLNLWVINMDYIAYPDPILRVGLAMEIGTARS